MRYGVLSKRDVKRIVTADMTDPFEVLGMHPLGRKHQNCLEIRAFCPDAVSISLLPDGGTPVSMKMIHEDGLFVWLSDPDTEPFPYRLLVESSSGNTWETRDTYSFPPQIGEHDLLLFSEGRHPALWERFGAVPWAAGEEEGVLFSVWAPNARSVSVVGTFNDWDRRRHPMRNRGASGIWELFVPGPADGDLYKYAITSSDGRIQEKADPLALRSEIRPATSSVVTDQFRFDWTDADWMENRTRQDPLTSPVTIYEVHAPSWKRPGDGRQFMSWQELSEELIPWVKKMGFTHLELLPITEHPFDGSWGYQAVGFFSPTSRLGTPEEFAAFVDTAHGAGIGVILDWTPAHFPNDPHGLAEFDGTCLYEYDDPRMGRHPDWDTLVFNLGRPEVRNFLKASALYWLERFHADGLRVDAVASMLYRDYSRKEGEWVPNEFGGNENLEAVSLLRDLNVVLHERFPGVMVIAEESTAWPGVSRPVYSGGLGFTFKWNMGWMNDTLAFFSREPVHRKHHIEDLSFSMVYAFSENFLLPLSHDEVVHGKGSLISKMPGEREDQFASLRLLLAYQWAHPGKKLLFMGAELAQWSEWDHDGQLDWRLADYPEHNGILNLITALNGICRDRKALHELDASCEGFRWVDFSDRDQTVMSFLRFDSAGKCVLCVFNLTPVLREGYMIGVPGEGDWELLLNTDSTAFGGYGRGSEGRAPGEARARHGFDRSLDLTLPPLGGLYLEPVR